MSENKSNLTVCVCGGGNASHVAVSMFTHSGYKTNMFLSFKEEADKLNAGVKRNNGITVHVDNKPAYTEVPNKISHDPSEVIPDADIILLIIPAFAYKNILTQIAPHVSKDKFVWIGAIPGTGGFDFVVKEILGDKVGIFGGSSLPWACRIKTYGESVDLLGAKLEVPVCVHVPKGADVNKETTNLENALNGMYIGSKFIVNGHYLNVTLFPTNQVIHPAIMYGLYHDWDGTEVEEKDIPLFYQGVSEFTASILNGVSEEVLEIRKVLEKECNIELPYVEHVNDYIIKAYAHEITDKTNIQTSLRSNRAFRGLKPPMTKLDNGKFVPNFQYRYLSEDIPHGLTILYGMALLCNVDAPVMKKVLLWSQDKLGKSYLTDSGKLDGPDMKDSTAPQRFGLTLNSFKN